MGSVLVIDDEPSICWSVRELLVSQGHLVETAASVEQARPRLREFDPDAVVLDVRLPGIDGLTALPGLQADYPNARFVVITAFGNLQTAVTALGQNVFEYLVKPFDLHEFGRVIERALEAPTQRPVAAVASEVDTSPLVGSSPAMQQVFRQIALVAATDFPVLLLGETGTGKDLAARSVHNFSPRNHGPFVPVCLADLSPSVLESELFGHVRGAFTGAQEDRAGLFAKADSGTLFLDEIAETPLELQVKLLRVLETQHYSPVGSSMPRRSSARVIAATNKNLRNMITHGTFREDLFHRLNVVSITMPPLRDRLNDIPALVERFINQLAPILRPAGIAPDIYIELACRRWPGNVRELRHALDHAVVLARRGIVRSMHLPDFSDASSGGASQPSDRTGTPDADGSQRRAAHLATVSSVAEQPADQSATAAIQTAIGDWVRERLSRITANDSTTLHAELMQIVESELFTRVLDSTGQNRSEAARILGVDRTTLRNRMKQLFPQSDSQ